MGCYNCGQEGHMSRECTEPRKEREDKPRSCYNCGQEGHQSRDCTEPKKEREERAPRPCFNCGQEGHQSRDCTEPRKEREDNKPRGCFNCGQEGHSKQDCPEPPKPRGCFNCGEEGHMSKECTNPRKENVDGRPPRREGAEGEEPKLERYVPPEMLEGEAIFEERNKVYEGSGINFSKYSSIPFKITGEGVLPSAETFKDLNLRQFVLDNLEKCGYKQPTPIQKHGSPQLMMGKHVMCCAQTGSGKTAAFLLPIINTLLNNQNEITAPGTSPATPEALILAPTRELAIQIGNEANMYSNGSIIRTQVVYGGTATFSQKSKLIRGCNILVATPGRLKQFVREQVLDLSKVQFFILDEADRMLDMGFMPDVEEIVGFLPRKEDRVSGMFSATFPDAIQQAARKFLLDDYIYIVIGVVGGACTDVSQDFLEVERTDKRAKVLEIIQAEEKSTKILVFCGSKKGADFLASYLSNNHVSTTSIHGDRLQSQREAALREFTLGQRQVLVATAVAARGLDIPKVSLVINYDLPSEVDEYVHRIGRTGRVGHTGRAISFFDRDQDTEVASKLVSILKDAGQNVPDFLTGSGENGYGGGDTFNSTDNRGGMANGESGGGNAGDDDDW